jgi:hypothetical protein
MHIRRFVFYVQPELDTEKVLFWDITPCSPMEVNRRFEGKCRLHVQGRTPVDSQRTTLRYIPEDSTLHNHRCENLKSKFIHHVPNICMPYDLSYGRIVKRTIRKQKRKNKTDYSSSVQRRHDVQTDT